MELSFPVGSKNASGNKQVLVARLELFIDKNANNFAKKVRRFRRRPQKTAPRFSSAQLIAKVRENRPVGTGVTMIQAQDTNNGYAGKIKSSMEASQNLLSQSFFEIDPNTGLIKTSASLDREKMPTHYFRIKAEYEQDRSLYAEADLTIYVDDVNDNTPNFESSSYSKVIPEDIYIGETVLDVRARDLDTGSNVDIRYNIINNSGVNSAFAIGQSSGSITIDKHLDRETVQQYSLTVQAITVIDVNDFVLQFLKREYSKKIPENIKTGELVLTVSASDEDLGTNGEVTYNFSSGKDQELFSINHLNGQIKVNKKLDYE